MENEFYTQAAHGPYDTYNVGDIVLEGGGTLRACTLAYSTFGMLNAAKDNAILVTTNLVCWKQQNHGAGLYRSTPCP